MKYVLIIGDGMAENPLEVLAEKTPLETAVIPSIDSLAERGVVGNVKTVPDGFEPGSDTAIMSIFGCSPLKYFSGRAPLELAAMDIFLAAGDSAMRCNNIAMSANSTDADRLILSHSGGGIHGAEGQALVEYLFAHPQFKEMADELGLELRPAASYRHLVIAKGTNLGGVKFAPPHDHLDEKARDNYPVGGDVAEKLTALLKKAAEILESHPINEVRIAEGKLPANAVWFWGAGTSTALPSFFGQYKKTGAVISAVGLVQGIAKLVGLDVILVDGATGELETNYEGKVEAALESLKTRDFAAVHIEAPDECSHAGDVEGKLQAIEWLDSRVVKPIVDGLEDVGEDFRVLIVSDHKTLCVERIHDGDPVPFIIYDSRVNTESGLPYTEKNGEAGICVDAGYKLMDLLFENE